MLHSETVILMKDNEKNSSSNHGISIRVIGGVATGIAVALAFFAFALASRVGDTQEVVAEQEATYNECSMAINNLERASDYLTTQARSYVVTGRKEFMDAYMNELDAVNRRGKAVEVLRSHYSSDNEAARTLNEALAASDSLAQTEFVAMHLAASHYGLEDLPEQVSQASIDTLKGAGGDKTDLETATSLLMDENYDQAKKAIVQKVEDSSAALLNELDEERIKNEELVRSLLFQLRIAVALLLCDIMVLVLALFMYVLKPLSNYVRRIRKSEALTADGAYELHYLANAYNAMYEDNVKRIEQLRAFAECDPLTGISNRGGYDNFLATHTRDIVLLLIDVDNFAEYNAVYGHDTGDAVLVRLASALGEAFRSTDFPCRIESDTFAVIMTNMSTDMRDVIVSKVEGLHNILADGADDIPLVTLSVGAAFSTEGMTDKDIFRAAENALRAARKQDSNSIVFYGEHHSAD